MQLRSQLSGVELRHSRLADAQALADLLQLRDITEEGLPSTAFVKSARVRSAKDMIELIQSSFLAITAVAAAGPCSSPPSSHAGGERHPTTTTMTSNGHVVGFLALGTAPRVFHPDDSDRGRGGGGESATSADYAFPPDRWESILHSGVYAGHGVDSIRPSNTLWLSFYAAPSSAVVAAAAAAAAGGESVQEESGDASTYSSGMLLQELLTVALSLSPRTANVLCPLPPSSSSSSSTSSSMQGALLSEAFEATALPLGLSGSSPPGFAFQGTVLHIQRKNVIPPLAVRPGCVEDYDDFVPLLVRGAGVITELPDNFYLEETLKDQDATHKVGIAENSLTHEVVGLTCAHVLSPEEQQHFAKQYALEPFNKLRPTGVAARDRKSSAQGSAVRLDFLYFDEIYNGSAHEFVSYLFDKLFPTCEYLLLTLPHAQAETPMLRDFTYVPIRQYEPHNSRGEFEAVPPGLWVCSRHSALNGNGFVATAVRSSEERALAEEFLRQPALYDLKGGIAAKLREDMCVSLEKDGIEEHPPTAPLPSTTVFRLCSATTGEMVGIASARRMLGKELYMLKANYDLDEYLSLYPHTGEDYSATDLSQSRRRPLAPELNAVMLRALYVRPAYRTWIRFLVREVLRGYVAEVACTLTPLEEVPYAPLLRELIAAKPRRVVERGEDDDPDGEGEAEVGDGDADDDADGQRLSATASRELTRDGRTLASLHFTTARFLGDEKQRIHTRLVVVGASATGIGFLHALLSTPFACFDNLVLVSTDGLPPHPNHETHLWRADHLELMEREYLALQQGSPIRVVPGALVDLDKVNRFVTVDNGTCEPYDYLILATGRQYVLPPSVRQLLQQEGRTGKKSVVPLNGELALDKVRQSLADIDVNSSNVVANVMVYGSGLDTLAVAAAMVEEGFSAQRIVVCAREEGLPPHMDEATYQATTTLFRAMGLSVLRGYDVSRMEFDDENNLCSVLLSPVSTQSEAGQSVELACCLVVCVEDKDIDANVLSTLNKRSIVFDGRVIVNRRYRTTDPHIFAAGPVAMWTRRYGTATPNFEDYSARDVGAHLAQVMLGYLGFSEFVRLAARSSSGRKMGAASLHGDAPACMFEDDDGDDGDDGDDDEDASDEDSSDDEKDGGGGGGSGDAVDRQLRKKLPVYTTPTARRVRLPGGYHFFSVQCVDANLRDKCDALTCDTVDPAAFPNGVDDSAPPPADSADDSRPTKATRQSVVSVYVNRTTRRIDGVVYFGLEKPPTGNLRALVGLPEKLLNLTYRYNEARQRVAAHLTSLTGGVSPARDDAAAGTEQSRATVNLPAHSNLTAGVRCGELDVMQYLRLPHLQTVFYDRFTRFFHALERRSRAHADAMELRQRILAQHKMDSTLTPEQIASYQAELTAKQQSFAYDVQLALIAFLHQHKNFRPSNMYLPNVERAVASKVATTTGSSSSHGTSAIGIGSHANR